MNTLNVIQRIKQELDDQGVFYTDEDIFDSLQDGYDEISSRAECIERVFSTPFPAKPYWEVQADIVDCYRIIAIYNPNTRTFLEPVTMKHLDIYSDKWETEAGTPQWFVPIDFKYVAFYPYYAVVPAYNMYVLYTAQAPDFTNSLTLDLPGNHQSVIEDYVVNDLLDQALEYKKSALVFDDYLKGIAKITKEVGRRNKSDRIYQMMVQINASME